MASAALKKSVDVRGHVCPYTFVKAKLAIELLEPGDELEILLDYPPAAESIGRAMKELGHEMLSEERMADSSWRLVVRKGQA